MERTTLKNRPVALAPMTRLEDFTDGKGFVRVSLTLRQGDAEQLTIDAQGFEVDGKGANVIAPDGRPSRTPGTQHTVMASALGDTHTLNPDWVRIVGTYTAADFTATGTGKPSKPGTDGDEYFDTASEIGYRWDEGEVLRIARGKADEMGRIRSNSRQIAGLAF